MELSKINQSRYNRNGYDGGDEDEDKFFASQSNDDSDEEENDDIQEEVQINYQTSHSNIEFNENSLETSDTSNKKKDLALVGTMGTNILTQSNFQSGINAPCSRRPDLSKITEVPDEMSFSFRHGVNALEMINANHEQWSKENHLRLPSTSFHASRYSMKYSWEESALRHQNSVIRPELDLSAIQCSIKLNNTSQLPNKLDKSNKSEELRIKTTHFQQPNKQVTSGINKSSISKAFISGNRHNIYFGFRRLYVDSEETLTVHNVHPEGERLEIRCWIKSKKNFKIVYPEGKLTRIMNRDHYLKIVVSFTPTDVEHYETFLFVECKDVRNDSCKYKFLVHGHGGRSIVYPSLSDRSGRLLTSANGRYQLVVKSLKNFHFVLESSGRRSAFASILIYGRSGELNPQEAMLNARNVVLGKNEKNKNCLKVFEVRMLGQSSQRDERRQSHDTQSSTASVCTSLAKDGLALTIVIFWGEERARQRLKQFERKFGLHMMTFGRNFTKLADFEGESKEWLNKDFIETNISDEDFYYFERSVKLIFIDVHEKKEFDQSGTTCSSTVVTSTYHQPRTTCSAMSVASSAESGTNLQRSLYRSIVEVDPDTTMIAAAGRINIDDENDNTLTII